MRTGIRALVLAAALFVASAGACGGSKSSGSNPKDASTGGASSCKSSLDCSKNQVCQKASGQCVDCLTDNDCSPGDKCLGNACRPPCKSDNDCTPLGLLCDTSAGVCVQCVRPSDCKKSEACVSGVCKAQVCEPGKSVCQGNGIATCNADGSSLGASVACGGNKTCVDTASGPECQAPDAGTGGTGGSGGAGGSGGTGGVGGIGGAAGSGGTAGSSGSGGTTCTDVSIPVSGTLAIGDTRTVTVDFDTLPGAPGSTMQVCLAFTTSNPASARTIDIGSQSICYGPCDGAAPTASTSCKDYTKPSGTGTITIKNQTCTTGCQNGPMTGLVVSFPCGGSSATSCQTSGGGLTDCGPKSESCCTSKFVPGGTFYRSYDGVTYTDQSHPASVSGFDLDKYEVTVGRFRKFVTAWDAGWRPSAGTGKHAYLNGGQGLASSGHAGSFESGWNLAWSSGVAGDAATWNTNLDCNSTYATWTPNAGSNERRPMVCETWYEAYAFCIWDGGFLPSEAEWNYAAAGGNQQRVYPWSSPAPATTIDCTYANYQGASGGTQYCVLPTTGSTNDVGSESPKGDGRWGQTDLAGNVWDWTLDWHAAYSSSCVDCAALASGSQRAYRGGAFAGTPSYLLTSYRSQTPPANRSYGVGVRCARAP